MDRKLFFLRENPYFPEATLFELEDTPLLILPDRGDGASITFDRSGTIECPPFAENVPPGQCPVTITSFSVADVPRSDDEIVLDQSIHFQILVVPLRVSSAVVFDRVLAAEVESYYPSPSQESNYQLHVGHLRPGFYETLITLDDETSARLTFIKFFPSRFSETYPDLLSKQPSKIPERRAAAAATFKPAGDDDETALLNKALELATEWGENFRKPIHDRLRVFYPELSDAEIDTLTATVRAAESRVYAIAELEMQGGISEFDIVNAVLAEFPWMDESQAARLKNIGMYYARR